MFLLWIIVPVDLFFNGLNKALDDKRYAIANLKKSILVNQKYFQISLSKCNFVDTGCWGYFCSY